MAANQQSLNKEFFDAIGQLEMFILGKFSTAGKSIYRPASFFGGHGVMPYGVKGMNEIIQDYYRERNDGNNPNPVETIKKICEVASQELRKHTRNKTPINPHRRNNHLHEAYVALDDLNDYINLVEKGIHAFDEDLLIKRLLNISSSDNICGIKSAIS